MYIYLLNKVHLTTNFVPRELMIRLFKLRSVFCTIKKQIYPSRSKLFSTCALSLCFVRKEKQFENRLISVNELFSHRTVHKS